MGRRRVRWPAGLAGDPRGVAAGFWGGVVYRAALEMSELQGWGGRVPAEALRAGMVARHLNVPAGEAAALEPWLEAGIQAALREGLLAPGEDGYDVAEFEEFAGRKGNRVRQAGLRDRRRRAREAAGDRGGEVTLPLGGAGHVTPPLPPAPPSPTPLTPPPPPPPPGPRPSRDVPLRNNGGEATASSEGEGPQGAPGAAEPSDPRDPHPAVAALTAALRQRETPIQGPDPETAWFGELQTELVRRGKPAALVGRPALAAIRDQLNALRRDGFAAVKVAAALFSLPESAMPSEVVRFVRGRVSGGGRR